MRALNFLFKKTLFLFFFLPDLFFKILFLILHPFYKLTHQKRAYGRVESHLIKTGLTGISAKAVFKKLYFNAIDSYRFLLKETPLVIENEQIFLEALQSNSPIVVISIHQGPFEILHRSLCKYHRPVYLLTANFSNTLLNQALKTLREHPILHEYPENQAGNALRQCFKNKGILALLIDQGKGASPCNTKLFGLNSPLYLKLPIKANQMGASLVSFRVYKQNKSIVLRFETLYKAKTPDHILENSINNEVETWISEHPEDWTWNYHKNFR